MREFRSLIKKTLILFFNCLYCYFFLPISIESIVLSQIFEVEILMDLHVLKSPESENHIFSTWSVCMRVCVCACVYVCVCVCEWKG